MKEERRNLHYIDVMRTFCCMGVLFEHYFACFGMFYLRTIRNYTQFTPLHYITDGRMGINMFCTMGGFLIFYHSFDDNLQLNRERARNTLIKRIFFMFLTCAVVAVISVLIIKAGFLYNHKAYALGAEQYLDKILYAEPTLENLLICIKGIIPGQNTLFGPHFWTMRFDIIVGSLCLLLLLAAGENKKLRWFLYGFMFLMIVLYARVSFSEAFVYGMVSAEMCRSTSDKHYKRGLLITGMILTVTASVVSYTLGRHILIPFFDAIFLFLGYHAFGDKKATGPVVKFLKNFGSITYSIYLCHFIILITFSSAIYCMFVNQLPRKVLFCANFALYLCVTLVISAILQKIFINPLSGAIRKILSRTISL